MWLDKPQKEIPMNTIPLLRPAPGKMIEANLTGRPLRCYVHYARQRSWPCTGKDCTLCKKGITKRFYAYYPVAGRGGNAGILELTGRAESQLIKLLGPFSNEPFGTIELSRPGGRRNLPCNVKWDTSQTYKKSGGSSEKGYKTRAGDSLTAKEMKDALMRIWKLPIWNGTLSEMEYLDKLNIAIALQTKIEK